MQLEFCNNNAAALAKFDLTVFVSKATISLRLILYQTHILVYMYNALIINRQKFMPDSMNDATRYDGTILHIDSLSIPEFPLHRILSKYRIKYIRTYSVEEVITQVDTVTKPILIFIGISLDGMTWLEAYNTFRNNQKTKDISVTMLTYHSAAQKHIIEHNIPCILIYSVSELGIEMVKLFRKISNTTQ
ncbi:hypothetical protein [Candidatus Albibeggiatoa sp. nov. NOAA]|uniref:hypothetical protein n=1 Tax=Candidatus Albibeggiatoa sp. nov. NOAA TaxID=3162724 RepID=UPI0032F0C78C|nr:hypothetical protein [Thiotrichaceae bacterium]